MTSYPRLAGFLVVATLFTLAWSTPVLAQNPNEIVVIANKSLGVDNISVAELKRLFLKEKTAVGGQRITPINAKTDSALRNDFAQKALGMSPKEEVSYWEDQKIKSGTKKPTELSDTVKAIFSIRDGISYCYRKDFNPAVAKILLVL